MSRLISRLTKDSAAVKKSSGPVGALVLLPEGDGLGTDSWPVVATAAAGRATTGAGAVRTAAGVAAAAAVSPGVSGAGVGTARDGVGISTRATLTSGSDACC